MRIITRKQEEKALSYITEIRRALASGNLEKRFKAIELLANLTDIVGGIKGLKNELYVIEEDMMKPLTDTAKE